MRARILQRAIIAGAAAFLLAVAAAASADVSGPMTYQVAGGNNLGPPNNLSVNVVTASITPAGGSGGGTPQNITTDSGTNITTDAGVQITTD